MRPPRATLSRQCKCTWVSFWCSAHAPRMKPPPPHDAAQPQCSAAATTNASAAAVPCAFVNPLVLLSTQQQQADSHQPAAQPASDQQLRRRAGARPAAPQAAGAAPGAAAQPARRARAPPGLLGLPFKLVASGIHVMASVVQLTMNLASIVGDRVLPAPVMRAARGGCDVDNEFVCGCCRAAAVGECAPGCSCVEFSNSRLCLPLPTRICATLPHLAPASA